MDELIEKLKAATDSDRELDGLIYGRLKSLKRNGGTFLMDIDGEKFQFEHPTDKHPNGPAALYVSGYRVFEFTGSIDAARTLIPDGLYWIASEGKTHPDELLGGAEIFKPGVIKPLAEAEHNVLAIAICIAALTARTNLLSEVE